MTWQRRAVTWRRPVVGHTAECTFQALLRLMLAVAVAVGKAQRAALQAQRPAGEQGSTQALNDEHRSTRGSICPKALNFACRRITHFAARSG